LAVISPSLVVSPPLDLESIGSQNLPTFSLAGHFLKFLLVLSLQSNGRSNRPNYGAPTSLGVRLLFEPAP
jgi:hypothetical protein